MEIQLFLRGWKAKNYNVMRFGKFISDKKCSPTTITQFSNNSNPARDKIIHNRNYNGLVQISNFI